MTPRYPIYIPSKSRYDIDMTARMLEKYGVAYNLVVEPQEYEVYTERFPKANILTLPWDNPGSVIPARNWIKEHATKAGYARHWQLDDNIRSIQRWYKGKRIRANAAIALRVIEDFTDRYENLAIAGMNYTMFGTGKQPPFHLNCHVYSATLFLNSLPHQWRGRYNEDTDMCLQVLSNGWCTALVNAFLIEKIWTMQVKGGNTKELYQGDGRLKMARSLERMWPGVVETKRRFNRPQHVVKDAWRKFDTPLKLKPGIDLDNLEPNEYGMKLKTVKEVKSKRLQELSREYNSKQEVS